MLCEQCGESTEELVKIKKHFVCINCKPVALQLMKEGRFELLDCWNGVLPGILFGLFFYGGIFFIFGLILSTIL